MTESPVRGNPIAFPSWPTAIVIPMPTLKPVRTGREMKSATKPKLSSPAPTSGAPESTARVDATVNGPDPPGAAAIAPVVRFEIVDVVLTASARAVPSPHRPPSARARNTNPTSTGRPAIVA